MDACREPACKAGHHRLVHIKGGRKRQGQKEPRAALKSGTREGAHPETTDTLQASHQAEEEGWSCKVRTCRAELHKLRECGKFRELPPAARFDLCETARHVPGVPGPRFVPGQGRELQVEEPDPHGVVSGEQMQA